jgi:hypothetical protein
MFREKQGNYDLFEDLGEDCPTILRQFQPPLNPVETVIFYPVARWSVENCPPPKRF